MTEKNLINTLVFLNRVNLTGQEVPVFNEIINAINTEIERMKENTNTAE
jgi:hypothetical protein